MHEWGLHSRLQELSVVIASKNDFLILVELLKNKTKIKTLNIISTWAFRSFKIQDIKKVRPLTNIMHFKFEHKPLSSTLTNADRLMF